MTILKNLLILIVIVGLIYLYVSSIDGFLSINNPVEARILVVEGWIPDYALKAALQEFRNNHYRYILTTGGRPYINAFRTRFSTEALTAQRALLNMKLGRDSIFAVPVRMSFTDKTYTEAKDLRLWLKNGLYKDSSFNVFTVGPHARRTLLQYQKAFGSEYNIGIISVNIPGYDSKRWYRTMPEFKLMIEESFNWISFKLFFHPRRTPQ